jgi:hypothetical protein
MKPKPKAKPEFAARYNLVQEKIQKFFALRPDGFDRPPTAIELEACAVAIIATVLWTRGDHNKPPFHYIQDATHLFRQVKRTVEQREESAQPKLEHEITFTPKEAAKALGYTDVDGFWDAARRYFGDEGFMKWKLKGRITYAHLQSLDQRRREATRARAAKGRAGKSPS